MYVCLDVCMCVLVPVHIRCVYVYDCTLYASVCDDIRWTLLLYACVTACSALCMCACVWNASSLCGCSGYCVHALDTAAVCCVSVLTHEPFLYA